MPSPTTMFSGRDAVVGGERGLQVVDLGVAVFPDLGLGGGLHRGDGRGEGPKTLSLAPMRARKGGPRARSCVSGPTKGTVAGRLRRGGWCGGRSSRGRPARGLCPRRPRRGGRARWRGGWPRPPSRPAFRVSLQRLPRGALHEPGVREAALEAAGVLGQLLQRLLEAGLFGGDVDDVLERQGEGAAGDGDGDRALGHLCASVRVSIRARRRIRAALRSQAAVAAGVEAGRSMSSFRPTGTCICARAERMDLVDQRDDPGHLAGRGSSTDQWP
jgi:hypothetical protein